ncbi:unnamed protein product [Boreogadus saida]
MTSQPCFIRSPDAFHDFKDQQVARGPTGGSEGPKQRTSMMTVEHLSMNLFPQIHSQQLHNSLTTASQQPHSSLTAASQQPHSSLTTASQQPHSSLTAASQQPHSSLTAASQQPHSSLTTASQQPHSSLTAASQQPPEMAYFRRFQGSTESI